MSFRPSNNIFLQTSHFLKRAAEEPVLFTVPTVEVHPQRDSLFAETVVCCTDHLIGKNSFNTTKNLLVSVLFNSPIDFSVSSRAISQELSSYSRKGLCFVECGAKSVFKDARGVDSFCFSITAGVALPARSLRHYKTLIALTLSAGRSSRLAVPALVRGELVSTMDALKQIFVAIAKEVHVTATAKKILNEARA